MNRQEKEVLKACLEDEKRQLKWLEQIYKKAAEDVANKIKELSMREDFENIQSVIYQKRYQEALKTQIEEVLLDLHSTTYNGISDYLNSCYENGYVGAMYDIALQGIPVIAPIDPEQVVIAIQNKSKISAGLYGRLGEDVNKLKMGIRAEVSRGIVNGSSWIQVANKLAKQMNHSPIGTAKNNAMRIARTEGHRVQMTAQDHAMHKAQDKGADIVKQWDATLDSRTRPSHMMVDGEIRELDEPFSNGLMMPSDPNGGASEVVNCRCAMLQRAKWALDEEELQTLQDRADFFGLDKSDNFQDFKDKYLQITPEDLKKALSPKEIDAIARKQIYENWEEYRKKFLGNASEVDFDQLDSLSFYDSVKLGKYKDKDVVNTIYSTINNLSSEFYSPVQRLQWMDGMESINNNAFATSFHGWGYGTAEIRFNPMKLGKSGVERLHELSDIGYCVNIPKGKEIEFIATHEYGHCILNMSEKLPSKSKNFVQCDLTTVKNARKEIEPIWKKYVDEVIKLDSDYSSYSKKLDSKFIFELEEPTAEELSTLDELKSKLDSVKISKCSMLNDDEFVAECFADARLNGDKAHSYSKDVYGVLEKYFGK